MSFVFDWLMQAKVAQNCQTDGHQCLFQQLGQQELAWFKKTLGLGIGYVLLPFHVTF